MGRYIQVESGENELIFGLKVFLLRLRRHWRWLWQRRAFAQTFVRDLSAFPYQVLEHRSPLIRRFPKVDLSLQYNKVHNLRLAIPRLNNLLLGPGETFSFWYLVGPPTRWRGYREGLEFRNGEVTSGVGGGLCQLSNLLFWLALRLDLEIVERHRHTYDFFPDEHRTQPFGSGATVFYNYLDLQFRNPSPNSYVFSLEVTETELVGRVWAAQPLDFTVEVFETGAGVIREGGQKYRINRIHRRVWGQDGNLRKEEEVAANRALILY